MPRRSRLLLAALTASLLVAGLSSGVASAATADPAATDPATAPAAPTPTAATDPAVPDPSATATADPAPTPTDTATPSPLPVEPAPTSASPIPEAPIPSDAPASPPPDPALSAPVATGSGAARPSTTPAPTFGSQPGLFPSAPTPAPEPNDGVIPPSGQVDEFLALTAQRDQVAARLAAAQVTLSTARTAVTDLAAQRDSAGLEAASAHALAALTDADVQDVARAVYQTGDSGLAAIATALTSGTDGLLDRLDNVRMVHLTETSVLSLDSEARQRAALADARVLALTMQIDAASAGLSNAERDAADAQTSLAAIDARLGALSVAPPQTAIGPDGCPTADEPGTLRDGAASVGAAALCRSAVRQAATPQAALAIQWAFSRLGSPYACGGAGRLLPFRMDCSSFVSRAYAEGAGLGTAGPGWAPSTRNMVPWDGVPLDPHYAYVAPTQLRAGDLVTYDTCPQGGCPYKHVVMYLGSPDGGRTFWMAHTNSCGDVAKVEQFWGFPSSGHPFLVARRVLALPGELVHRVVPLGPTLTPAPVAAPSASATSAVAPSAAAPSVTASP